MSASPPGRSRRWGALIGAVATVAACLVCCGPLLAVLGSVGVTSAIASLWVPGLALLAVAAGFGIVVISRRRRTAQCRTTRHADLGIPSFEAVPEKTRDSR